MFLQLHILQPSIISMSQLHLIYWIFDAPLMGAKLMIMCYIIIIIFIIFI